MSTHVAQWQWSTGYNSTLSFFTFYGNYMYFPNTSSNKIVQTNLDGTIVNASWASINSPISCIVYNNYLYVTEYNGGNVKQIFINKDGSSGAISTFATGFSNPVTCVVATVNNIDYLFVMNFSSRMISKLSLTSNKSNDQMNWASVPSDSYSMDVYNGNLYIANNGGGKIIQINLLIPTTRNNNWASGTQGVTYPVGLVISNGYLYVSNNSGGQQWINKISLTKPDTNYLSNWITGIPTPVGMAKDDDNFLYVLSQNQSIYKINYSLLDNPFWSSEVYNSGVRNAFYFTFAEDGYCYFPVGLSIIQTKPDGTIVDRNWITFDNQNFPTSACVAVNGYLYCGCYQTVTRISLSDKSIIYSWASLEANSGGKQILTDGTYLYVGCGFAGIVTRINISTRSSSSSSGSDIIARSPEGDIYYSDGGLRISKNNSLFVTLPAADYRTNIYTRGLCVVGSYLYVTRFIESQNYELIGGRIYQISLSNPSVIFIFQDNVIGVKTLTYYNDYLYAFGGYGGYIGKYYLAEIPNDPYWSNSTEFNGNLSGLTFDGIYAYYADTGNNRIIKLNLNGTINTLNWALPGTNPQCSVVYNGYLYVTNSGGSAITQILISNPTVINRNWASVPPNCGGIVVYGDLLNPALYVASYQNGTISKIPINIDNTAGTLTTVITGLNNPLQMVVDKTYLYVANSGNNTISKIILSNPPAVVNYNWASLINTNNGLSYPSGLIISNGYLYVSNLNNNTISQILLYNPSVYNTIWKKSIDGLNGPSGLGTNGKYLYVSIVSSSPQSIGRYLLPIGPPIPPPCFKKDTKILTDKGYIPVQYLRKGDLVKTLRNEYKAIEMIGKKYISHDASQERSKIQLFICRREKYPELFEDLILTGCHSLLVDKFTSDEQREKTIKTNGDIYITDNKYRLPAYADEKADIYELSGIYAVYHLALENEDYYMNYGIYANGLLAETCSRRFLKEYSGMNMID